jgi:hypothetical protein
MKRRIILSIALVVSVVVMLSLVKSESTVVSAEPPQRSVWDTGIVTLGENQILRVVSVDGELGGGLYGEVVRRIEYQSTGCEAGICKYAVASQNTSAPLTVASNESISIDTLNGGARRIVISSNNRNLRVNAIVFDTATKRVIAVDVVEYISSSVTDELDF